MIETHAGDPPGDRRRAARRSTDQDAFERKILAIRKQTQNPLVELAKKHKLPGLAQLYMPSFSTRTVVYKGLLLAPQVESFYDDLRNPLTESALALVHQRFSTNTFPSWRLAHPYRFLAHNGEINTVRGNVNWMYARRRTMASDLIGADLDKMWPLIPHGQSDTACIDNALELLVAGGYSLSHAMMMLIPEAWAGNPLMDAKRTRLLRVPRRADGAVGRPGRASPSPTAARSAPRSTATACARRAIIVTDDDQVIMASEAGVLPIPEEKIVRKWRLQPGKMLLIDLEQGRIIDDEEIKRKLAEAEHLRGVAEGDAVQARGAAGPARRAAARAVQRSDRRCSIASRPSATRRRTSSSSSSRWRGAATIRSARWAPTRRSPCSRSKPKLLYNYFKQNFAQVTNPPIDPIREELVMSLVSMIGPRPNLLGPPRRHAQAAGSVAADPDQRRSGEDPLDRRAAGRRLPHRDDRHDLAGQRGRGRAGDGARPHLRARRPTAVLADHNILILSDRAVSAERVPIPALLATAAVHHHLIRQGLRTQTGLVVETGEAREVHHFCVLAGYGAEAINPYLAFETLEQLRLQNGLPLKPYEVQKNYIKAVGKGILKVMSKMGISTYQSYCGAQIFDAVGLSVELRREVLHRHRHHDRRRRAAQEIAEETVRAPPRRLWRQPDLSRPCSMSAATTPSACAARTMPGRRNRSPSCSTPCAAIRSDEYKAFATIDQRPERAAADHPRPDAVQVAPTRRSRSRRSSPPPRSSSASPPAR